MGRKPMLDLGLASSACGAFVETEPQQRHGAPFRQQRAAASARAHSRARRRRSRPRAARSRRRARSGRAHPATSSGVVGRRRSLGLAEQERRRAATRAVVEEHEGLLEMRPGRARGVVHLASVGWRHSCSKLELTRRQARACAMCGRPRALVPFAGGARRSGTIIGEFADFGAPRVRPTARPEKRYVGGLSVRYEGAGASRRVVRRCRTSSAGCHEASQAAISCYRAPRPPARAAVSLRLECRTRVHGLNGAHSRGSYVMS